MSHVLLNGIALAVALPGLAAEEVPVGGSFERSFSGAARSSARALKRSWKGTTSPLAQDLASNVRRLLWGEGHVWTFDGESGTTHYSALKGLPGTGASSSIGNAAPAPKYGTHRLQVASATQWAVTVPSSSAWTIMLWHSTGGAWTHYVVDSGGRKWVNGARNDAAGTAFLFGSSTAINLFGLNGAGAGATAYFDDVVYLPYLLADTTWPAQIWGAGSAFGPLPRLKATGVDFPDAPTVVGRPASVSDLKAAAALYQVVEFTLEEV